MVDPLVAGAIGVVVGAGIAWVMARAHGRAAALAGVQARESRLAAAEAITDELKKQISQRELEASDLRAALASEQTQRAQAEARWTAERRSVEEQRRLLDEAQARLGETFKALSVDALRESNSAFLQLAQRALAAELEPRQRAMDGLVQPLTDALRRYEEQVRQLELAGMTEHCDYLEQVSVEGEGGRLRPDMLVRLPNGREVIVDAKVPLAAYLDAQAAATDEDRQAALGRHAQQVRHHMNALSGKAYWEEFARAPAFVVMFIPGESFVAAAAHADPGLIEDGMAKSVVVATPTTLIALLHAIAFGWRQEQVAENAERLRTLGAELHDRIQKFAEHLERLGVALGRATGAFNEAVGSLEHRVLPSARRFRELGAATGTEIAPMKSVDVQARSLAAPELPGVEPPP